MLHFSISHDIWAHNTQTCILIWSNMAQIFHVLGQNKATLEYLTAIDFVVYPNYENIYNYIYLL